MTVFKLSFSIIKKQSLFFKLFSIIESKLKCIIFSSFFIIFSSFGISNLNSSFLKKFLFEIKFLKI